MIGKRGLAFTLTALCLLFAVERASAQVDVRGPICDIEAARCADRGGTYSCNTGTCTLPREQSTGEDQIRSQQWFAAMAITIAGSGVTVIDEYSQERADRFAMRNCRKGGARPETCELLYSAGSGCVATYEGTPPAPANRFKLFADVSASSRSEAQAAALLKCQAGAGGCSLVHAYCLDDPRQTCVGPDCNR